MVKPRVVVTRRWPEAVEALLADRFDAVFNRSDRAMSARELKEAMCSADAVLTTAADPLGAKVLDVERPRVRIIGSSGAHFGDIDLDSARRLGIAVTNTPDVASEAAADLTLLLMLMAARETHSTTVAGKTLGIVGLGRVGQMVARRAKLGFGMRVLACDSAPVDAATLERLGIEACPSLDDLLGEADFVSLHCPGGGANRHLIDAARLGRMRPDAILIDTSRGELVDLQALSQALWFETIGGAALDLDESCPSLPPGLRACDRLVLPPRSAKPASESREAIGLRVARNLEDFFAGRAPHDLVS